MVDALVPFVPLVTDARASSFPVTADHDKGSAEAPGSLTSVRHQRQGLKLKTIEGVQQSKRRMRSSRLKAALPSSRHADFSFEVKRSLYASDGCVLLVDASQGPQAQTYAHLQKARDRGLPVIAALNKVDLVQSAQQLAEAKETVGALVGVPPEAVLEVSAKTGQGVVELLEAVVRDLPAPSDRGQSSHEQTLSKEGLLRALVFDSFYDPSKGVVLIAVIKVGYIYSNLRNASDIHVGDTLCLAKNPIPALPEFEPPKRLVYAGLYPEDPSGYQKLKVALQRLLLTDAAVEAKPSVSQALGHGFRCGFLGALHMEVVHQRLEAEFGQRTILASPGVSFLVEAPDGRREYIENATQLRKGQRDVLEPMQQQQQRKKQEPLQATRPASVRLVYRLPLAEILVDFTDKLLSATSGAATFDVQEAGKHSPRHQSTRMSLLEPSPSSVSYIAAVLPLKGLPEALAKRFCARTYQIIKETTLIFQSTKMSFFRTNRGRRVAKPHILHRTSIKGGRTVCFPSRSSVSTFLRFRLRCFEDHMQQGEQRQQSLLQEPLQQLLPEALQLLLLQQLLLEEQRDEASGIPHLNVVLPLRCSPRSPLTLDMGGSWISRFVALTTRESAGFFVLKCTDACNRKFNRFCAGDADEKTAAASVSGPFASATGFAALSSSWAGAPDAAPVRVATREVEGASHAAVVTGAKLAAERDTLGPPAGVSRAYIEPMCVCEEDATASAAPNAAASAHPAGSDLSNTGAGGWSSQRIAGSLFTVYLLLHVHVLPQQQQKRKKQEQQRREKAQLDSAAISNGLSAALLQNAGLLGVTLLPFKVLSYDARLSFAIVKTDAATAPSLILAAANVASLNAAAGVKADFAVPCFVTLVRAASTLHALACPRRPNACLLL
ncbi:hypothetical protein ACSSS7_007173 [Eimeria intestinalis]